MEKNYSYNIDRVKEIPISSVVEKYDTVKKVGATKMTHCPWHNDHKPSLSLNEKTGHNYCHCFACGKGGSTIDYVMQHENVDFRRACEILSNDFGISTTSNTRYRPIMKRRKPQPQPPLNYTFIPNELVSEMQSTESSLVRCMHLIFAPALVEHIVEEYQLGNYESWKYPDCTAFPSIDRWGKVHNIKTQHYCTDPNSSSFFHCDDKKHILWLGSIWSDKGILPADATFNNVCLFGEHLLNKYPTAKVALVESPKNAIVGAAEFPEYVWVASGNKLLKREILLPLTNRDVIVFPDLDAHNEWEKTIAKNQDIANFHISHFLRTKSSPDNPKSDIADYIINSRMNSKT